MPIAHERDPEIDRVVNVLKLLADPTRLYILDTIADGPKSVGAICRAIGFTQPAVSHHLALLRVAGLVDFERHGQERCYSLQPGALDPVAAFILDLRARASGEVAIVGDESAA